MSRIALVSLVLFVALSTSVSARDNFGAGVIAGEPTGITGKLWLTPGSAVDGAVAWSFRGNSSLHVHADYLLHKRNLFDVNSGMMALYFGIGGRVEFGDDPLVGIRVPVGLNYFFQSAPVGVFGEIVPILDLVDQTDVNFNAALGVRYFFGGRSY